MSGQLEPAMVNDPQILPFPAQQVLQQRAGRNRLLTVVLVIYWLGMFLGTHMPHPPRLTESDGVDKWMHFGAYLGLSLLLTSVLVLRRPASGLLVIKIVAILAAVGAFDEITQLLVGRDCEFLDWCADVIGAALGSSLIVGFAIVRRRQMAMRRSRAA